MDIRAFFLRGDLRGAIDYMRSHAEFAPVLPAYTAIFEREEYRRYAVSDRLNAILRLYQVYYRDVFYCGLPEQTAAKKLLSGLQALLGLPGADEDRLQARLTEEFAQGGYHALFGKTQGYYGPYLWRETVPMTYRVELPGGTAEYSVNLLRGFLFRSWMDYLTFGQFGTGGWVSPDGTINCVEQAYDLMSERFRISLLKHEAQHAADQKRYPGILPAELEYRAKLVELCYSGDPGLLRKFCSEAKEENPQDSHALASAGICRGFADVDPASVAAIQARALGLFTAHSREMDAKYGALQEGNI